MTLNIGLLSLLEEPLGAGAGMYHDQAIFIEKKYELHKFYPAFINLYHDIEHAPPTSSMGRYFVENGIIFFIFLFIIFSHFNYNLLNLTLISIAFLYIMTSLSIAFPPAWVLLAIANKNKCIKKFWLPAPVARFVAV